MRPSLILFAFALGIATLAAAPDQPSSKVIVTKDKVTFDPKTCTTGAGGVSTGVGGARVKVLGHKDGYCEFEYITDGCGGCFAYYRCKVPVDSGPVTVEVKNGGLKTSFPMEKAKLFRTTGPAVTVLVEGTEEFVTYRHHERRSEMEPKKGDKVKFRFRFYDGAEFKNVLQGAAFDPTVEFVVGSGTAWPWLETAMEHMTVGDKRQVQVPLKIAAGATKWLPPSATGKVLHVEISLVLLERAK
jgi:hypothetical protein